MSFFLDSKLSSLFMISLHFDQFIHQLSQGYNYYFKYKQNYNTFYNVYSVYVIKFSLNLFKNTILTLRFFEIIIQPGLKNRKSECYVYNTLLNDYIFHLEISLYLYKYSIFLGIWNQFFFFFFAVVFCQILEFHKFEIKVGKETFFNCDK